MITKNNNFSKKDPTLAVIPLKPNLDQTTVDSETELLELFQSKMHGHGTKSLVINH